MRIGIEAQRIFRKKKHGMDIVALELIRALRDLDKENEYFIFVRKGPDSGCLPSTGNVKVVEVPGVTYLDWEQVFLPLYARQYDLDVLHCTSNTGPVLYHRNKVVTLHDVIFLEKSVKAGAGFSWYQKLGRVYRQWIVPATLKTSQRVITVSNFEKDHILKTLPMAPEKISVIYNAVGEHFRTLPPMEKVRGILAKYEMPANYIFYMGNTDPKKNIHRTIRAYGMYCRQAREAFPLVIADITPGFLDKVLEETACMHLKEKIKLTGYIANQDLPSVYAGASLFLYPSLRESFGIPLLEAMACGTPVLTSGISALPEVAGNAAIYADPFQEESIGKEMLRLLEDPALQQQYVENGKKRASEFTWSASATSLLKVYSSQLT